MKITIQHAGKHFEADLQYPIDLSIPLEEGWHTVNAFHAPPCEIWPVRSGTFVGDTREGAPMNFMNVRLNPHGNGTHTECVGHITKERVSQHSVLKKFHFIAKLVSIFPQKDVRGDRVIKEEQLRQSLQPGEVTALVIRTMPNDTLKRRVQYGGSNPPYLSEQAARYLVEAGIEHLLVDLPSVDREEDGGRLAAHRAFWQYPNNIRYTASISELIYVDNDIKDGLYLLNIQTTSLELDAGPSKPVLYRLKDLST